MPAAAICSTSASCRTAVAAAMADIDPTEDNRGPIAFKMHVAKIIIRRAIERAIARA